MMMFPSGQAVPVLPGPVQMPSVINVRQNSSVSMFSMLYFNFIAKKFVQVVNTCVFMCLIWSSAGPARVHGT